MVAIPAGEFWMGSASGEGDADESPQHQVALRGYCIDRTEVTVARYRACVMSGVCPPAPTTVALAEEDNSPEERRFWNSFCNAGRTDREDHPINCIDWTQATAYCGSMGGRLPTEAEWEFAARGVAGQPFPWGAAAPDERRVNACGGECQRLGAMFDRRWTPLYAADDRWADTAPAGSFPSGASASGVLDLAGNVSEWTADWLGPYPAGRQEDPIGAASGSLRVRRGGGWNSDQRDLLRAANRSGRPPSMRMANTGFRCVVPLRR